MVENDWKYWNKQIEYWHERAAAWLESVTLCPDWQEAQINFEHCMMRAAECLDLRREQEGVHVVYLGIRRPKQPKNESKVLRTR